MLILYYIIYYDLHVRLNTRTPIGTTAMTEKLDLRAQFYYDIIYTTERYTFLCPVQFRENLLYAHSV